MSYADALDAVRQAARIRLNKAGGPSYLWCPSCQMYALKLATVCDWCNRELVERVVPSKPDLKPAEM